MRHCLEELNGVTFTNDEWELLLKGYIASGSDGVPEKTAKFQRNWCYPLKRRDGTTKNIEIVDKDDVNRNRVQVINQYVPGGGTSSRPATSSRATTSCPDASCGNTRVSTTYL